MRTSLGVKVKKQREKDKTGGPRSLSEQLSNMMEDRDSGWKYVRDSELTAAAASVVDPSSEFPGSVPLLVQVTALQPLPSTEIYHGEEKHRSRGVRERQLVTPSSCTRKRIPKRLQRKKDSRRSSGKAEVKCAKEKDRVRNIRIQYNKLRETLGDQQLNKRLNKLKVLNAALDCIGDLQNELDRCSSSASGRNLYRGPSSYSGTNFVSACMLRNAPSYAYEYKHPISV